jgi:hydrogenase maturation protease
VRGNERLVVGVGNALLGDEGFGVHVARMLEATRGLPPGVRVLEAGTALFDFVPEFARAERVMVVDAIRGGRPPGTLYRLELGSGLLADEEPELGLSLHDWGVLEALRGAKRLGLAPRRLSIVGAEPESLKPGLTLTPTLERARDRLVTRLLAELAGRRRLRTEPIERRGRGAPSCTTPRS